MSKHDWSQFTSKIYINDTAENVFNAWATQKGMEGWFLKKCSYQNRSANQTAQSGDDYSWTWYTTNDYTDTGKVTEVQGPNFFQFTFGPATCSLTIKREHGATLVELVQKNIPTDEISKVQWNLGCQTGWSYFLLNLKSWLEHKTDLREKDKRRMYDCDEVSNA